MKEEKYKQNTKNTNEKKKQNEKEKKKKFVAKIESNEKKN